MALITPTIPPIDSQAVGLSEVQITDAVTEVVNLVNGNIELVNLAPEARPTSPPLVTSLPTSPIDGQQIAILLHADQGVIGYFRYRAASPSPYKWEAVGSPTVVMQTPAGGQFTVGQTVTGLSGTFTLPFSGDWVFAGGAANVVIAANLSTPTAIQFGVYGGTSSLAGLTAGTARNFDDQISPTGAVKVPGLGAGTVVSLGAFAYGPVAVWKLNGPMYLHATPARIG